MYRVDIGGNLCHSAQEFDNYCGEAVAQMCRNGYPNRADRLGYPQTFLHNLIQHYNSTLPVDVGVLATDPHGLAGCLNDLLNPTGVDWVERSKTNRDAVLFSILHSMDIRRFPSPVLVDQGNHWVLVVGWETHIKPTRGSSPTLNWIRIFDPSPLEIGSKTWMQGAQWFSETGYWECPVSRPGTWNNKYVAIVEPEEFTGKAKVSTVKSTGKPLLARRAVSVALRAIKEAPLREWPEYGVLFHKERVWHRPMLVQVQAARSRAKRALRYYIVPFGLHGEYSERGAPLVRVVVLVNAESGDFEEVTAFCVPIQYLTPSEAINVIAAAMQVEPRKLRNEKPTLMFQSGGITRTRSYPFWQVKVGRRFFYVDQRGTLYARLPPGIAGN